jgi:hypothetical protein
VRHKCPDWTEALVRKWRDEAEGLRHRGQERLALMMESMVTDLDAAHREHLQQPLTLSEAAMECKYSRAHLGRLVRDGKIPNAGKPNAPRVLRKDLPTKLTLSPPQPVSDLSSEQIVRSVTKLREG